MCLGVVLKDSFGRPIAKAGSWDSEEVKHSKCYNLNDGERLIGVKYGTRGNLEACIFDLQFVIGAQTDWLCLNVYSAEQSYIAWEQILKKKCSWPKQRNKLFLICFPRTRK